MKIKLICGFRRDQEHSIDADEAHKAYYLFLHPESRGIFNNGLALIGSDIREIVPDYQGTMGWNHTHILDSDDWNEIRKEGVDRKINNMLSSGKEIARLMEPSDMNQTLTKLLETKYVQKESPKEISSAIRQLAQSKKA
jgi:hypothetical protein